MTISRNPVSLLAATAFVGLVLASAPAGAGGPADGINVNVVNTPFNPVPVTLQGSADTPALQAVSVQFLVRLPSGTGPAETSAGPYYTVPTGKRLVIEFVDTAFYFQSGTNTGKVFFELQLSDPVVFTTTDHAIGISSESLPCRGGEYSCFVVAKPVTIYANPGTQIGVNGVFVVAQSSSFSYFKGNVNGHLVNLP